ncbi:MAG: hypothetical protein IT373_19730 [Polyangiaceae bacterium]|nr:hypothetical protein [Polyangiaceae bacterium]
MKILRIRRGFTTNSSGANEFLPDGGIAIYDGGTPGDGGTLPGPTPAPVLTGVRPWDPAPP